MEKAILICAELVVVLILIQNQVECGPVAIEKRSAAPERVTEDSDYIFDIKYDEYPMVVPRKRAALLVDRLMVALQKAIEEEEQKNMDIDRKNLGYGMRQDDAVRSVSIRLPIELIIIQFQYYTTRLNTNTQLSGYKTPLEVHQYARLQTDAGELKCIAWVSNTQITTWICNDEGTEDYRTNRKEEYTGDVISTQLLAFNGPIADRVNEYPTH